MGALSLKIMQLLPTRTRKQLLPMTFKTRAMALRLPANGLNTRAEDFYTRYSLL